MNNNKFHSKNNVLCIFLYLNGINPIYPRVVQKDSIKYANSN